MDEQPPTKRWPAFRAVLSIAAGVVLALVLVIAVEFFSAIVHPFPPDFKGTMEETCKHVERYPHWVLAVAAAAWGGTAFASTWVTRRLGGRDCATFLGLYLLAGVVFNITKLPYPIWFKIACLIVIPAAILLGLRSSSRSEPATAANAAQGI